MSNNFSFFYKQKAKLVIVTILIKHVHWLVFILQRENTFWNFLVLLKGFWHQCSNEVSFWRSARLVTSHLRIFKQLLGWWLKLLSKHDDDRPPKICFERILELFEFRIPLNWKINSVKQNSFWTKTYCVHRY